MATPITPIPDLSQYNYEIGDTVEVVTKQNALNAEFEALGQDINTTVASINDDVDFITTARNELDAAQIVHAPGSGLPNEAGTAYSSDVTTSATDTTAGRVLTTDAGPAQAYKRANILGTVSQSGGVPTGAIIERGSNANGEYVKFADGTVCGYAYLLAARVTGNVLQASWVYPVSVNSIITPTVMLVGNSNSAVLSGSSRINANDLATIVVRQSSTTGATIRVCRDQADFATGDACTVFAAYKGRWY